MRKVCLLLGLFLVISSAAIAQDAPKVEVFGGYSYLRINPGSGFSGINLNGWNASVAGNFNRWLGVKADFSGNYGSPSITFPGPTTISVNTKVHNFLFGPQISARRDRFTVFGHALFGGTHVNGSTFGVSASDTGFGMAFGGGLDVKVHDHFALRLGQADYLLTRISGDNQHNFRYSAGVVLRF
jgi:opacity protein-like surface antigen